VSGLERAGVLGIQNDKSVRDLMFILFIRQS